MTEAQEISRRLLEFVGWATRQTDFANYLEHPVTKSWYLERHLPNLFADTPDAAFWQKQVRLKLLRFGFIQQFDRHLDEYDNFEFFDVTFCNPVTAENYTHADKNPDYAFNIAAYAAVLALEKETDK